MTKAKKIVLAALLLAILIVLERLVSIQTPILRVSLAYIPIMLCAIILGPAYSAGIAVIGDLIGATLFSKGFAFFPGFTLSALLTGLIHGFFLYNTKSNKQFLIRLILSTLCVLLFIHTGLNSLWLVITVKKAFTVFASTRIISALIFLPIEVVSIYLLKTVLDPVIKRFISESSDFFDFEEEELPENDDENEVISIYLLKTVLDPVIKRFISESSDFFDFEEELPENDYENTAI
ncbi:MAG: hypothetical protein Ta2B_28010 [Termitinemataceae bacterium]|nr:MAG: hypothetical protein Ta2B_28010 [Termitinemataceae bacterium]